MKHLLVLVVGAVLLMTTLPATVQAEETWREKQCRYARLDGKAGYSQREVAKTIECGAKHWDVIGGVSKALDVARCESGLREDAYNPAGPYIGVYQYLKSTWDSASAARQKFMRRWEIRDTPRNGRANVLITIRIAQRTWSPWSCA